MDIQKIIEELRAERAQIEEAIVSLERLSTAQGKRRGRPPKWLTQAKAAVTGNGKPMESRNKSGNTKGAGKHRSTRSAAPDKAEAS